MMGSRASIELCRLRAQEKVMERRKEALEMILLERDSLIAMGKEIPEPMIDNIKSLHNSIFCAKEVPRVPVPPPPAKRVISEDVSPPMFLKKIKSLWARFVKYSNTSAQVSPIMMSHEPKKPDLSKWEGGPL